MRGRFLLELSDSPPRYPRRVRRIVLLAAIVVASAACGSSAASTRATPTRIEFGLGGGNIVPFQVTIEPTGRVRATGTVQPRRRRLSHAKVVSLSRLVRHAFAIGLRSRQCAGTNPDVGSDFIRAVGRTVRVHGSCEPRFHRLWNTLAQAVGPHRG
jgi:hypothetical protein